MLRFMKPYLMVVIALVLAIAGSSAATARTAPAALTVYVFGPERGVIGSDGQPHEAFVPASLVVKAGSPVRLIFVNYSGAQHNFVQPTLDLDLLIPAGTVTAPVTTTVAFTPKRKGVYRWFCSLPCDKEHGMWAMGRGYRGPSREGFMAGDIVVL